MTNSIFPSLLPMAGFGKPPPFLSSVPPLPMNLHPPTKRDETTQRPRTPIEKHVLPTPPPPVTPVIVNHDQDTVKTSKKAKEHKKDKKDKIKKKNKKDKIKDRLEKKKLKVEKKERVRKEKREKKKEKEVCTPIHIMISFLKLVY